MTDHNAGFYIFQWAGIIFLVSLSGLFAGLTLGLLSLDITGLEIVIASGTPLESKYARKIYPVRQRGNLLLCTLLLGNVGVNSLLSILMADMTSGFLGFIISTGIIVVAGEIIPQAACSRHALAVGAHTIWIVYLFMFLFFPFSFPISKALDFFLGSEMGTIYSRKELKKLLDIHSIHTQESGVSRSDVTLLTGVLDFSQKKVAQVMTPLDRVFMLDISTKLDYTTMTSILENGHSRMPVYEHERSNIIGCLYMRDLVLLNPEDSVPLKTMMGLYHRQLLKTWHDTSLDQMLSEFKTGKSHMAVVHRVNNEGDGDPFYENLGIICLEDVLEEILQDEILDESDHYHSNDKNRGGMDYRAINSFHGPRNSSKLSPQQIVAIYNFLSGSLPEFSSKLLSEAAFQKMLATKGTLVLDVDKPKKGDLFIYNRGVADEYFTIVLQGKLEIRSGSEGFVSEGGPFTTLGLNALKNDHFVPDFSARIISQTAQLVKISKVAYENAVKLTTDEYSSHVFNFRREPEPDRTATTYLLGGTKPIQGNTFSDGDTHSPTSSPYGGSLNSTTTKSPIPSSSISRPNNNNNNNNNNNTPSPPTTTTTSTTPTSISNNNLSNGPQQSFNVKENNHHQRSGSSNNNNNTSIASTTTTGILINNNDNTSSSQTDVSEDDDDEDNVKISILKNK
ncbi:Ancient conserved domain protein 2 [Cavenderia fasciculata]|uniref:Ancient conserved domain protein 2 n=1 Tax=Cavenderia fasciculata TaxID=261658 RepID=F4QD82_CACFS|nr:Ancient conserved domain protein 2 [Cavenderia fasciculata]EGG14553.1 Ancient conserved domain protein 2 [Cavenderia fasciculata]|eukprot:XP_004366073.1 Ancient conserved domain protein 2 [Cavenderia fasciculata]